MLVCPLLSVYFYVGDVGLKALLLSLSPQSLIYFLEVLRELDLV